MFLLIVAATGCGQSPRQNASPTPVPPRLDVAPDLPARLARWKPVPMPFAGEKLTARERGLVEKLIEACRQIENIFWRQSDPEAMALYNALAGSPDPRDKQLRRLLWINGSHDDLLDSNKPFVGTEPMPPGLGFYPKGLTRDAIETYVKTHPEERKAIYDERTIVVADGEKLSTIPYHVAYKEFLGPAARALNEAAELSDDPAFVRFLKLRAEALVSDD